MRRLGGSASILRAWAMPAAEFSALLLVGLLVRLGALLAPGHNGDTSIMVVWAQHMAAAGPGGVYDDITSVYPALLYLLWPLGAALSGPPLELVIKGLSIPFDLALATLIALITLRIGSRRAAFAAAAIYLLNPAVLLAGPVWGQVDAAGTVAYLGALAASAGRRHGLAGGLGMLAGMLKPQFGLVLLPVAVVAVLDAVRGSRIGPALRAVLGAAAVYVLVAAPLALDPLRYGGQLSDVANFRAFGSLHAMNPWGLLLGFETPEGIAGPIGLLLLVVGLAASVAPLRRRSDLVALLASGAFVACAFYFLPTRAHERYLFPAMAVLAPLAVRSAWTFGAYLALSVGFAASLLYALVDMTPFSLPPPIGRLLITGPAVWAIGLVMMAAAATLVGLLWSSTWRGRAAPAGTPA